MQNSRMTTTLQLFKVAFSFNTNRWNIDVWLSSCNRARMLSVKLSIQLKYTSKWESEKFFLLGIFIFIVDLTQNLFSENLTQQSWNAIAVLAHLKILYFVLDERLPLEEDKNGYKDTSISPSPTPLPLGLKSTEKRPNASENTVDVEQYRFYPTNTTKIPGAGL